MDTDQFDALARTLARTRSRRQLTRTLAGLLMVEVLSAGSGDTALARRKRKANGAHCTSRRDCKSALCSSGTCKACTVNTECGSDGNGSCICIQPKDQGSYICVTDRYTGPFKHCSRCPDHTFCYISNPGEIYCYKKRCGA
jgi:hypothetical protein